jgi:hypothetical protein
MLLAKIEVIELLGLMVWFLIINKGFGLLNSV